MKLSHFHY